MTQQSKSILFILPTLKSGGAERVISTVADNLDSTQFSSHLLVIGNQKDAAYKLTNKVEVIFLNKSRVLKGIPGVIKNIKNLKPDIVVTTMSHLTNATLLFSFLFPKVKFISREANIKKITKKYHKNKTFMSDFLNTLSHSLVDHIICQSQDMANELMLDYNVRKEKISVINNPISENFNYKAKTFTNSIPKFITVGRLHNEKGYVRILECLKELNFPFHYTIIGNGPHQHTIEQKINELGLNQSVAIINHTSNPEIFLHESDVFLQCSFAEGFPNALLESCATGVPVIAFECLGGTKEIIQNGINGFIVKNKNEFIEKLNLLIVNNLNPEKVSESVFKKFDKSIIVQQYQNLFNRIIKPS